MYVVVIAFVATWIVVYFTDTIFKTCMFHPYLHVLHKAGISIKPFYFQCYVTHFNRCIKRWSCKIRFLRLWFDIGIVFTVLLALPSIYLLLIGIDSSLSSDDYSSEYPQLLQPTVLGLNVPVSQTLYYLFSLFLCSIIHELGHALAAARENVPVAGCGFMVFVLIPIAFVSIPEELLSHLSLRQKLRIFTAGIWHNVSLACISFLLLLLGHKLYPFGFMLENGVSVIDIQQSSLSISSGFTIGDQITMIDACPVKNLTSWKLCLRDITKKPQSGYCSSMSHLVHTNWDSASPNCCGNSSSHLCFKYSHENNYKSICLQVREFLRESTYRCKRNSDCGEKQCVFPIIENDERLISITARKSDSPILYVGFLPQLFASVSLSPWIPHQSILGVGFIEMIEKFLIYVISFSSALAILNVIPCPVLDGQWLCSTLIDYLFIDTLKVSHRRIMLVVLQLLGSALLITYLFFSVYKLVVK